MDRKPITIEKVKILPDERTEVHCIFRYSKKKQEKWKFIFPYHYDKEDVIERLRIKFRVMKNLHEKFIPSLIGDYDSE